MLNLDGLVDIGKASDVAKYTTIRFKNKDAFKAPEALTLHEQHYLEDSEIKALCEKAYGLSLYEPDPSYVPLDIIDRFIGTVLVPVVYSAKKQEVTCVSLVELGNKVEVESRYNVKVVYTTPHYYFEHYQRNYGRHPQLSDIPSKMLVDMLFKEGIELGAADLTMSSTGKAGEAYYNVRKRKVRSNRIFSGEHIKEIIKYLTQKSPYDFANRDPRYADVTIDKDWRGRVLINRLVQGFEITVRFISNEAFSNTLEELNLSPNTAKFLREQLMDKETGLRLIVGPTMSGKNWTASSLLYDLVKEDKSKIVSIEIPVEQYLPGVEQISCETPEEYRKNIETLIHMNPDFVYITEIRDSTGKATVYMTNTGKRAMASMHSNGVADTIPRMTDITGLSIDRIIQTVHSIVYQELVRDEDTDTVSPKDRYVRFTKELKYQLYGKSLGEVIKIISDAEEGDKWN